MSERILLGQNNGVSSRIGKPIVQVEVMNIKTDLMGAIFSKLRELKVDKTDPVAEVGIKKFDGGNQEANDTLN